MGMEYDPKGQCWRLDLAVRIDGRKSPTHLKDTVHGPKRQTQAEAMRRWLEMHNRAKNPEGSLTFGEDCDKHLADNPRIGQGIVSIINHLKNGLGHVKRSQFAAAFAEWIEKESKRNVKKWKRVDGELQLVDIDKQISASTVQAYKRYAKLIARGNGYGEAFAEVAIGRRVIRRRPIEPWEMLKLEEAIQELYPWFYPAFDFARTNPIRPEDQFSLTVEKHVRRGRIIYEPCKTFSKTGLAAYPFIWEHQREWFDNLTAGLIFPRPDGTGMMDGDRYYDFVWGKIRAAAGIKDIQFYDLRHHAVAWMRSHGIEDWRIVKAAGWASTQMLVEYDPDNRHLIDEYDSKLKKVASCSTLSSTEKQKDAVLLGFLNEKD